MDTREAEQKKPLIPNGATSSVADDVDPEERSGPGKRNVVGAIGAVVVVLLLIVGVKWFLYARVHESTDDARVDADPVAITSKINERIDKILVSTDQEVHAGQLLIVLDQSVAQDQERTAQAQYDLALAMQRSNTTQGQGGVTQAQGATTNAAAQVPVAQSGVEQAQAQLRAAQAQVPAAQAAYDRAAADYNRTASLVGTGDVARAAVDAAQARVGAAQAGVSAALGGVTTAQGKLAQAGDPSQVEAARAQLSIARQNLGFTQIKSPINGFVGEKSAEVGQTVQAGMTLLTLIPDGPGQIFITANYKETQLGDMRVGQPVDITVDAYKGVTFHGHLISINPASQSTYALVPAQNATGNFVKVTQRIPVRISIDDMRADMPLRPGMSVETNVKVR